MGAVDGTHVPIKSPKTNHEDYFNRKQFYSYIMRGVVDSKGAFHSTQNSGNFGWYIKWNGPFRFDPTGIFGTSLKGGPL